MIFLDNQLQKVATLKIYQTNGLRYAQVGTGQTRIDTTESPSIRTAKYANRARIPPCLPSQALQNDDVIVMNLVQQDSDHSPSQNNLLRHNDPKVHSTMAWTNPPPLLQRTDTCSASDSDKSTIDLSYQINDLPTPSIPIVITTSKKDAVSPKPVQRKKSNCNRRYYIHGQRYQRKVIPLQCEYQRMITDTLDIF